MQASRSSLVTLFVSIFAEIQLSSAREEIVISSLKMLTMVRRRRKNGAASVDVSYDRESTMTQVFLSSVITFTVSPTLPSPSSAFFVFYRPLPLIYFTAEFNYESHPITPSIIS